MSLRLLGGQRKFSLKEGKIVKIWASVLTLSEMLSFPRGASLTKSALGENGRRCFCWVVLSY